MVPRRKRALCCTPRQCRCGRAPAGQRLARESPGARGRGAHRRSRAGASGVAGMLFWLTQHLSALKSGFHVFSYLTLRAILAMSSALVISLLVGPGMIARLSRYQIGQVVRDDGPKSHLPKAGTPTMGGALILVAVLFGTLMWANVRDRFVWTVLGVTFAFGLIGFYDDYLKLSARNSR